VVVGGGGGASDDQPAGAMVDFFFCFMKMPLPKAICPHDTHVLRGVDVALDKALFAGPAVPSALCREFPRLGKGAAKGIVVFAESILLLANPANQVVTTSLSSIWLHSSSRTSCLRGVVKCYDKWAGLGLGPHTW
jgi:hypothetical protein